MSQLLQTRPGNALLLIALEALLPGCAGPETSRASPNADREAPLLVLLERDPWLTVIGSDSPTFALYGDGYLIMIDPAAPYGRGEKRYVSARLDPKALEDFLGNVRVESLWRLKEDYEAVTATDQPTNEIHVWKDGKRKSISVYGSLRRPSGGAPLEPGAVPEDFERVFRLLTTYQPENSSPWLPARIEVLLWPFENSRREPADWPGDWPSLDGADSLPDSMRRIWLPASEFPRLRELVKSVGERRAVKLSGRKWSIDYRLPFPSERAWMDD